MAAKTTARQRPVFVLLAVTGLGVAAAASIRAAEGSGPAPTETPRGVDPDEPAAPGAPTTMPESMAAALGPAVPTLSDPAYEASISLIDEVKARRMSASWRPGCPVGLDDLRLITLNYWDFQGQVREGELVVHARYAEDVRHAFGVLFDSRFPIAQIRLIDEFGGDDDRSMEANNTSGYNCRRVAGTTRWSEHASGRAVDINPVQNPYVTRGGVRPSAGSAFTDRGQPVAGMVTSPGPVVDAFTRVGWHWGGLWRSGPDYQHFSASGR